MRRILMAVAGYAFMAWWNNRTASREADNKRRATRTKTATRKPVTQGTRGRS